MVAYIAGDWTTKQFAVHAISHRWNGWAVPIVDARTLDQIVTDLDNTAHPTVTVSLTWDGTDAVVTTTDADQTTGSTTAESGRMPQRPDGLYVFDLGCCWDQIENPTNLMADPTDPEVAPADPSATFCGDWAPDKVYRAERIERIWNSWVVPVVTTDTFLTVMADVDDQWSVVLDADGATIASIAADREPDVDHLTQNVDGTWTLDLGWTFQFAGPWESLTELDADVRGPALADVVAPGTSTSLPVSALPLSAQPHAPFVGADMRGPAIGRF